MTENQLANIAIGHAISIHKKIDPGLLESAYEFALVHELEKDGLWVKQQVPMPFIYDGIKLEIDYRVDILIESKLIIEVKSIESLAPVHFAQTLTYLRIANIKLGLLINFNAKILKGNIHRIVNGL